MKRIIGLLSLTLVFTCCDLGVKNSSAETPVTGNAGGGHGVVYVESRTVDNMNYDIYHTYQGVHVVNVTKDKLEVELLQLQIDSLKL